MAEQSSEIDMFQKRVLASPAQTCPRRMAELGPWERAENQDEWCLDRGMLTCSFCGSVHPEEALLRIERGTKVIPTDKSYKVYLGHSGDVKLYFQHLSEEQEQRFIDLYNSDRMRLGYPGRFYVLPYFASSETSSPDEEDGNA